jgi:hypothetical protein
LSPGETDSGPPRFSLIFDLESRAGALTKDCYITNGFAERDVGAVYSRPGFVTYKSALNTTGQGLIIGTNTGTAAMWVVEAGRLYSGVA